jgi:hypothetical protein
LLRLAAVIGRRQNHGRRQIVDSALGNYVIHCGGTYSTFFFNCAYVYRVLIGSGKMDVIPAGEYLVPVTVRAVYTDCCVSWLSSVLLEKC